VEGGSAVVEIDVGGRWARLCLYCREVMATPRRMGVGVLGQQEWSLQGRFGCPRQIEGSSRAMLECCF